MSDALNGRPPTSFWFVGGAALVWNLIGLVFYFDTVTMSPEALQSFTEAQQNFFTTTPMWATSAYAVAVNAGVLGCLFLLLRKAWAVPMFILSLIGVILQNLRAFVLANGLAVWGTGGAILPAIVVVIAVALVVYSRSAKQKNWIS